MKNFRIAGIGFVMAIVTCVAASKGSDVTRQDSNIPLRLSLTTSTPNLRLGESFVLQAKLLNAGTDNLSLFGQLLWGYAGGLTLHVTDENGRRVEPLQNDDDMVVPSVLGNPEYYVLLFPAQFLGIERRDSTKNLFPKAGVYSIFIEYRSPVPEHYAKTTAFWGREKATIRSVPVRIQVHP
jgi:hypothetical protein